MNNPVYVRCKKCGKVICRRIDNKTIEIKNGDQFLIIVGTETIKLKCDRCGEESKYMLKENAK